jgi:UDP-N-acetylglucosamine/UDP-N-acetylgalactosamine 4-epimerase
VNTPAAYEQLQAQLRREPRTWLVTGVAGFIGSNLLETLLRLDQRVVGLDNFATGHRHNLDEVRQARQPPAVGALRLHRRRHPQPAGLPESLPVHRPRAAPGRARQRAPQPRRPHCHQRRQRHRLPQHAGGRARRKVKSFTYAASSSTYGDHPGLPKVEDHIGKPLSPYAVTKYVNELYADVFARSYGFHTIGLRYFNVFGPRQDPNGAYAAVIPKWTAALLQRETVFINGDGETSRDFCFVDNAVQANLLAATTTAPEARNQVYNVAVGDRTTLNDLFRLIRDALVPHGVAPATAPTHRDFRAGDVRHSLADVSKARRLLGYEPTHRLADGVGVAMPWYVTWFLMTA